MNKQDTIKQFIEGYAETSTGEENLTKDIGAIFDYFEKKNEQREYDLASVIDSLEKIVFFEEIEEQTEMKLKLNIKVLEKMKGK
ncbi:hypothetical protein KA005_20290 [bacterium]|nr:hypothetical protein [bacterium]